MNVGAVAAWATAVAGIVRTITDPEMVERINKLVDGMRNRPRIDQAAALRTRAAALNEQLAYLASEVDNDEERAALAEVETRIRRVLATLPTVDLAPNPRKRRALLIRLGNALDEVTKDLVDQMIGEAVEAQPVPRRRPTLRALGRKRGDSR